MADTTGVDTSGVDTLIPDTTPEQLPVNPPVVKLSQHFKNMIADRRQKLTDLVDVDTVRAIRHIRTSLRDPDVRKVMDDHVELTFYTHWHSVVGGENNCYQVVDNLNKTFGLTLSTATICDKLYEVPFRVQLTYDQVDKIVEHKL